MELNININTRNKCRNIWASRQFLDRSYDKSLDRSAIGWILDSPSSRLAPPPETLQPASFVPDIETWYEPFKLLDSAEANECDWQ